MNIGIFTDSFTPEINGVVTSIQLLTSNFQKMGHEVFIFAPNNGLKIEHSTQNYTNRYPSILILGKQFRLAIPLIKSLDVKKLNLDIIHIQTPGPIGIAGIKIAKKLKIPLVYTYHTRIERYAQYYLHLPANFEKTTFSLVARKIYNKHDVIIAPSEGIKKELEKFITKPIIVIPTGINNSLNKNLINENSKKRILEKYNLKPEDILLITTSRIAKEKNIQFIIDSFSKIKKTHPRTKLLIAGDGPDKDSLMEYAQNTENNSDIIFLGFLKHDELFSLYNLAKLFIFSSLTETQGLVILEAMSVGLPVVAVSAPGVEDMLSDNQGGFITTNDQEDFIQKINSLLENSNLWNNKKQEALQKAQNFSIENMALKIINLYTNLLKK